MSRSVVLSGFMATGKSTVGRFVAAELGLPFIDTDAIIADDAGRPVGELFAAEGEARFRDRESAVILPLLTDGIARVIAFGGGAVTIPRVRHTALEAATLITLTATPETIESRVTSLSDRPNLGSASPIERARDLLALRRHAYGECHASVVTDDRTPMEIAAQVVDVARRDSIAIPLGDRSYVVELGDGAPSMLTDALRDLAPSSIVTVTDDNVNRARGAWLDKALEPLRSHLRTETRIVLTPGEENKTLESVARIWDGALGRGGAGAATEQTGIDRQCVVVAFGGGVVGDLAGFAASTLLRGVRCVQVATTLLAMVDSSVGGKTGFDHATGKNLIGAFFQPSRVVIDLEHLTTLPPRQLAAALAEVVKIAIISDSHLLEKLETNITAIVKGDRDVLREIVRAAVIAKMRIVRADEHESGVRALLNLGHTIGHALEAHGGYTKWLHGEAVAIGTVIEIAAAERLGLTPLGMSERVATLLGRFRLPAGAPPADIAAAWPFVMTDKKRTLAAVKLPIVTALGEGRVERVDLATLRQALDA